MGLPEEYEWGQEAVVSLRKGFTVDVALEVNAEQLALLTGLDESHIIRGTE